MIIVDSQITLVRETQFVGENPSFDCEIKYLLPKRHTFGKMTFEIQDMNGNLLSKLGAGKSKGIKYCKLELYN